VPFVLPPHGPSERWELVLDTHTEGGKRPFEGGKAYDLAAHSMALFRVYEG
jgi:hypothetical protein